MVLYWQPTFQFKLFPIFKRAISSRYNHILAMMATGGTSGCFAAYIRGGLMKAQYMHTV